MPMGRRSQRLPFPAGAGGPGGTLSSGEGWLPGAVGDWEQGQAANPAPGIRGKEGNQGRLDRPGRVGCRLPCHPQASTKARANARRCPETGHEPTWDAQPGREAHSRPS